MRRNTPTSGCSPGYGYTVIIAEKPKAAEKIAWALGRPVKCRMYNIPYWILYRNGEKIVVASSAGHLFGLYTNKRGFPVYDYEWRPSWEYDKGASYLKKFYLVLSRLLPHASKYINACDYDIEGSVIGYMIIENLGNPKRAYRMVFSSLGPSELRQSYENLRPLDVEMVEAGKTRHEMDWLWGINVSRALMDAVRKITGRRIILSAGRVQSPTLVEAVRRWREAKLAVPLPTFTITITLEKDGAQFQAYPNGWSPSTRIEAARIARELRDNPHVRVERVKRAASTVRPPPAFNLGDLQSEAARLYGFSPMKTQKLAEDLYLDALISYPRTNSQKLPPTINYTKIIGSLSRNPYYSDLVRALQAETGGVYKPVQGRKDDPAHPAIYPTGVKPRSLDRDHARIYDLIVRRFLAAFSKPAVVERIEAYLVDWKDRSYTAKGVRVSYEGWWRYYHYLRPKEISLPSLRDGERVMVVKAGYQTRWVSKRPQLSKTSLLKWMETQRIGTEATRARIIEVLYKRGYLVSKGGKTVVTDLGMYVSDVIEELFPDLARVELTRKFEEYVDAIRFGKTSHDKVIEETIKQLDYLIRKYKERLEQVGSKLAIALGVIAPKAKCVICGREAVVNEPFTMCSYHLEAYRRLRQAIPVVAEKMGVSEEDALKLIASRKGEAGQWVVEVAKLLSTLPSKDKG